VEAVQLPCTVYIYLSEWLLILILVYLADTCLVRTGDIFGIFLHLPPARQRRAGTFCDILFDICLLFEENKT
jgi:hypothetical protein